MSIIYRSTIINTAVAELESIRSYLRDGKTGDPSAASEWNHVDRVGKVIEALKQERHPLVQEKVATAISELTHLRGEWQHGKLSPTAPVSITDTDSYLEGVIGRLGHVHESGITAMFIVTKHEYHGPSSVAVVLRPCHEFPAGTNGDFWTASPYQGEIKLTLSSLVAQMFFKSGYTYALTFDDTRQFGGFATDPDAT